MLISKVSIFWIIYICCLIKFSFSRYYVTEEKLLFRNYTEHARERCPQMDPLVLSHQEENVTVAVDLKISKEARSSQAKFSKISMAVSAPSKRLYSLSEESRNARVHRNTRLSTSTQENVEERLSFFVIAAIFNPASFKSRYNLYHKFTKHMNDTGAQLITIECIFPSLNQTKFEVTKSNNPWHIQLKSESVYWMKENLINIAVSRLPPHAKWISWLDADIEFEQKNWVELTIKELKKYTVVQIFERAKSLGPSPMRKVLRINYSFGYSVVHQKPINRTTFGQWYPHPGYGWAMSLNDFRAMNGLPDYNIVGSGDRYFANSLINKISDSFKPQEWKLSSRIRHKISDGANQTFKILQEISKSSCKAMLGYVSVTVKHNWHGSKKTDSILNDGKYLKTMILISELILVKIKMDCFN